MKVSTAYICVKGFELTPQQFVELVERLNDDVSDYWTIWKYDSPDKTKKWISYTKLKL